jgi:hypothetical protein
MDSTLHTSVDVYDTKQVVDVFLGQMPTKRRQDLGIDYAGCRTVRGRVLD